MLRQLSFPAVTAALYLCVAGNQALPAAAQGAKNRESRGHFDSHWKRNQINSTRTYLRQGKVHNTGSWSRLVCRRDGQGARVDS